MVRGARHEPSQGLDGLLPHRPRGRLHLGLRATWLQHSDPAQDSLTDLSQVSLGPSTQPSSSAGLEDQVPCCRRSFHATCSLLERPVSTASACSADRAACMFPCVAATF